jgi:hypothetical protein
MYNLSSKDVNRIIVACKHYASDTGSEWMYDEYHTIINKLCTYLDQNFDNDVPQPLECYINNGKERSTRDD